MRVDTARKWIRQNLPRLQKKFRLEDWQISVTVVNVMSEDDPTMGACECDSDYQFARITIAADQIEDIEELDMAFQHELIHCVLSPFDQVAQLLMESDNEMAAGILGGFYRSCVERTVRNLELVLGLGIKSAKIV